MEHIPYGYRIENGIAVIDERAEEQVQRMFENYLNGDSLIKAAENAGIKENHGSITETDHSGAEGTMWIRLAKMQSE